MLKNISHKIFITVFLLIALHATPDGPQSARYTDAIHSLVDFGTFALQPGYRSAIDIVLIKNHLYAVIPPGIPLILAPLYLIHRTIMSLISVPIGDVYWSIFNILTNIFVMAPLLGVVAVMMFETLSFLTDNLAKKLWLVFVFIFGSLIFFYSTNGIWSHVYTMSFIFMAFYLMIKQKSSLLIGLCLGLAQLFDYIAVLPISLLIGFWIYIKIQTRSRNFLKAGFLLSLGYLIFLALIMYYNQIITGSVFATPNSLFLQQLNQEKSLHQGMFTLPSIDSLWGLTLSPFRGIFLYFPMTFLFTVSLVKKNFIKNKLVLFSCIFVGFIFLFNSTYYAWSGDVCFGPRHLVVAIPFLIIPIVYCQLKYIKILGALSIFINLAGVSTIPSNNLFVNIAMFLDKGLFLHWLDYGYKVILPKYYNMHISYMTPLFIYVATALMIYLIWKPSIKQKGELGSDKATV